MTQSIPDIIQENQRRRDFLFAPYDPIFGTNSLIPRIPFFFTAIQSIPVMIPETMGQVSIIKEIMNFGKSAEHYAVHTGQDPEEFLKSLNQLRMTHDFEFFAFMAIKVEDKISGQSIPLKCRYSQRRIIAELERQRTAGIPVRLNIPKSRQFGSTTVIQAYCFWIQNIVMQNWHVAVAAHLDDAAKNIREMYVNIAKEFPEELGTITLIPHAKSSKNQKVKETGSIIAVGSSQSPDNLRGYSFKVLHLSEVAYYVSTTLKKPEDLARTLASTVPMEKNTIIVRESTCNGVGSYWHRVCMSSYNKKSRYTYIFVPFFEIEIYHKEIEDYATFIANMSDYDWELLEKGATLESIYWYNNYKETEEYDDWRMKSEYPSDFLEAFQSSGRRVFPSQYVHRARINNRKPSWIGDIHADSTNGPNALKNIELLPNNRGNLWIWDMPETFHNVKYLNRYCVSMDIGGTSKQSDYSVIRVMDRFWLSQAGTPEVVATWRGRLDQDLLAWKAIQICKLYDNALFIPESNSLRSKTDKTEGSHFFTIIDEIVDYYENIYCRTNPEQIKQGLPRQYGFMTNRQTKTMIINKLKAAIRDTEYIEPDARCCDEMDMYEYKPDNTMGNVDGDAETAHDDILMSTAILVWCAIDYMPPVMEVKLKDPNATPKRRNVNEASFN